MITRLLLTIFSLLLAGIPFLARETRGEEGSPWQVQEVDTGRIAPGRCEYPSIVVDPAGKIHVSCWRDEVRNDQIAYFTNEFPPPDSWGWYHDYIDPSELADEGGSDANYGRESSLAVLGSQVIACHEQRSNGEYYLENRLGLWVKNRTTQAVARLVVDEGGPAGDPPRVGSNCRLGRDAFGGIHLTYYDETHRDIRYASLQSAGWVVTSTSVVAGDGEWDVGPWNSLFVSGNGTVHVVYYEEGRRWFSIPIPYRRLQYTKKSPGGSFEAPQTIEGGGVGQFPSMTVDENGKVHVCYLDPTESRDSFPRVKYATNEGGVWVVSPLAANSPDNGFVCSVAACGNKVHLSYLEMPPEWGVSAVKLLYRSKALGGAFSNAEVVFERNTSSGWPAHTAIACDPSGGGHIAYSILQGTSGGELRYAYQPPPTRGGEGGAKEAGSAGSDSQAGLGSVITMGPGGSLGGGPVPIPQGSPSGGGGQSSPGNGAADQTSGIGSGVAGGGGAVATGPLGDTGGGETGVGPENVNGTVDEGSDTSATVPPPEGPGLPAPTGSTGGAQGGGCSCRLSP